ncbi:nuclear factor 7, brain-like [Hemitrygon akajei]|uniref:nuclear factor 7, brain-like n=1 Tax=Hemitrygon akajei TaxID=2704970 RepID=UPI003BFA34CB
MVTDDDTMFSSICQPSVWTQLLPLLHHTVLGKGGEKPLPECREEFADRTLRVNRALANLSEKARKLNLNPKEEESKLHCEKHGEELKLFCETDETLICLICATAREHKSHNFMPVNEAVEIYKGRVKSSLDSLTEKKSDFEEMEQQQKEKISGVREQSHSLQSQITSYLAELHRVLTEKEQRALRDLREEEERILNPMEKNLREIQENLNSIREEISKLQERMDQQENITFLMEEARRKRRIGDNDKTLSVTDGALLAEKFYRPYLFDIALGEPLDSIKRGKTYRFIPAPTPPAGRHHCHMVSWRCQTLEHTKPGANIQTIPWSNHCILIPFALDKYANA